RLPQRNAVPLGIEALDAAVAAGQSDRSRQPCRRGVDRKADRLAGARVAVVSRGLVHSCGAWSEVSLIRSEPGERRDLADFAPLLRLDFCITELRSKRI